jgi:hypothetical protein
VDERLQEMLDHYEITKTLRDYCRGCDRCDEPLMGSVYLEDSWDDHGSVKASGAEFTRIMIGDILARTETLSHLLGQSEVTVNGDEAGAETYFIAGMKNSSGDGERMCNLLGGRFVDRLRREEGRWRIEHRTVLRDWSVSIPVHEDWTDTASLREGQRSGEDVSFAVLGTQHGGHQ